MARYGRAARRRRRLRLLDHHASAHVAGLGARRPVPRRAGRLQSLQASLSPRSFEGYLEVSGLRQQRLVYRTAQLQPDDEDAGRADGRHGVDGVPAAGDRSGHLRQLQERLSDRAQAAAVRHRADRQVVPQRDHARQLHVPRSRVRTGGARVFRPGRRQGHGCVSGVGRPAQGVVLEVRRQGRIACASTN